MSEPRLRELLSAAHPTHRGGEISVGVLIADRITVARLDGGSGANAARDETRRWPLGCAAKVLTGMLAMRAETEGYLDFDRELSDTPYEEDHQFLVGITPRHLLNHTHGLDVSCDDHAPLLPGGHIDRRALYERIRRRRRLFAPGQFYSYSSAGPWIVAALLEQAYSADFASLIISKVLDPAEISRDAASRAREHWCAATGAALALSTPELLRLLRWYLRQHELRTHPELLRIATPPGWCLERGACAGWKYYGCGWYGHNVVLARHSLVLRVQLEQRVAVVAAAENASASMTMIRMFGRVLPEYLSLKLPKPQPTPPAVTGETACTGVYSNAARSVRISRGENQQLEAEIRVGSTVIRTALKLGTDRAYQADAAAARSMQWIQFLSPGEGGYSHLWDGSEILRRVNGLELGLSDEEIEKIVSVSDPDGFTLLDAC